MKEDELNKVAYNFVAQVQTLEKEVYTNNSIGSIEHLRFEEWSDKGVPGPFISRTVNRTLPGSKITLTIEKTEYGFRDVAHKMQIEGKAFRTLPPSKKVGF